MLFSLDFANLAAVWHDRWGMIVGHATGEAGDGTPRIGAPETTEEGSPSELNKLQIEKIKLDIKKTRWAIWTYPAAVVIAIVIVAVPFSGFISDLNDLVRGELQHQRDEVARLRLELHAANVGQEELLRENESLQSANSKGSVGQLDLTARRLAEHENMFSKLRAMLANPSDTTNKKIVDELRAVLDDKSSISREDWSADRIRKRAFIIKWPHEIIDALVVSLYSPIHGFRPSNGYEIAEGYFFSDGGENFAIGLPREWGGIWTLKDDRIVIEETHPGRRVTIEIDLARGATEGGWVAKRKADGTSELGSAHPLPALFIN